MPSQDILLSFLIAQDRRITDHLSDNILNLYSKTCSYFLKIDDEQALNNELKKDPIIRLELEKWGGYLSFQLGPALSLISGSLITFSHVHKTASTSPKNPEV